MEYTFNMLPCSGNDVIVTSDDPVILKAAEDRSYRTVKRAKELSNDTASVKDVLLDVIDKRILEKNEIIIMLYLTYPERIWRDVECALRFFKKRKARSLLCKQEIKTHPFLCAYEQPGDKGKQIVKHNLYRRQDYPKVFEISHYIFISYVGEIKKLNKNLYNKNTVFYEIDKALDIDYENDFERFLAK